MSKLNVVMYHYVRDLKNSRYPDIKGMDYKELCDCVNSNVMGLFDK